MKAEIRVANLRGYRDERLTRVVPVTVLSGPDGVYAVGRVDLECLSLDGLERKINQLYDALDQDPISLAKVRAAGIHTGGLR